MKSDVFTCGDHRRSYARVCLALVEARSRQAANSRSNSIYSRQRNFAPSISVRNKSAGHISNL